jgi:NDP-sugar pyrophosphorylase family protein
MSFALDRFAPSLPTALPAGAGMAPWDIIAQLSGLIAQAASALDRSAYRIDDGVWVHHGATIEAGAIIKPPAVISASAVVAAHAYLRGPVWLGERTYLGPGSEAKNCIVLAETRLAHFNYVGDSIIGRDVNLEAGAVIANHFNERSDKTITVQVDGRATVIPLIKFGALIGDRCRIGANAVLSPGTILEPGTVVGRLQLVDQQR